MITLTQSHGFLQGLAIEQEQYGADGSDHGYGTDDDFFHLYISILFVLTY